MKKIKHFILTNLDTKEKKNFKTEEEIIQEYHLTLPFFREFIELNIKNENTVLYFPPNWQIEIGYKQPTTTKKKGNGEGTIYFSEALQRWVAQYTEPNGKRKTITQRKNEKIGDFKKRFNKIMASIDNGTYIGKVNDSLHSILDNHIEQKHDDGITNDNSYLRDQQTLGEIILTCPDFAYKPIQKVKTVDIEAAKSNMRRYKQSVIDKIWLMLKKGFKIAHGRHMIPFNIMDDETLTVPISSKKTEKVDALTSKQFERLNSILDNEERNHKYRNIVKLQCETGMRIGENLARSIFDVQENDTLFIHNTLTKNDKKEWILGKHTKTYNKKTDVDNGKRYFPMNTITKEIIKEQEQSKITNIYGLLFWDYDNNTFIIYSEINSWLRRLNEKYKISDKSLATHVIRHTRITEWRKQGMDMKVIQYLVGHVEGSSITDDIYTTVDDEFIEQELKKVNWS